MTTPSASLRALERLLVQRKTLAGQMLYFDGFDRWGPKSGPEYDQMLSDATRINAESTRVTAELTALATRLQTEAPETMRAWAQAHIALLERFIEANPSEAAGTGRFVASGEIAAWREVEHGERLFVEENCFYIHIDPLAHHEFFGDLQDGPTEAAPT
jgi:hypothetical protein